MRKVAVQLHVYVRETARQVFIFGLSRCGCFIKASVEGENMNYYVHHVPGRLRVKNLHMKGNAAMARRTEEFLNGVPGIHSASVNTVTGSTLVYYDTASVNSSQILATLEKCGHFDCSRAGTVEQYLQQKLTKAGQAVGKALLGMFFEKAFAGTPLALLSVVL